MHFSCLASIFAIYRLPYDRDFLILAISMLSPAVKRGSTQNDDFYA